MPSTPRQYHNSYERSEKSHIEENSEEGEEGDAPKEAGEKRGKGSVDDRSTRDSFTSSHPCRDGSIMGIQICGNEVN